MPSQFDGIMLGLGHAVEISRCDHRGIVPTEPEDYMRWYCHDCEGRFSADPRIVAIKD